MTQARRDTLPGWRAGLLVLGVYAMFLQAFVAGFTGPAHFAAGAPDGVICRSVDSAGGAPAPAMPHSGQDCVCAAMCHAGSVPAPAAVAGIAFLHLSARAVPAGFDRVALSTFVRALPQARAPPRRGFVLQS